MSAPHTELGEQIADLLCSASPDQLADAAEAVRISDSAAVLVDRDKLEAMDADAEWLRGYLAGLGTPSDVPDRIWDTERLCQL